MGASIFHERRKKNTSIAGLDRRNGDRRNKEMVVASNKRRLATHARSHERLNFHIPIRLKLRDKEVQGHTGNISQDGLLLACSMVVKVGTPLTLQFSFGKDFCYMNISGQVVFSTPMGNGSQGRQAVGIKFSGIRDWEQKVLISAVQELNQNSAIRENSLLSVGVCEDDLAIEAARFHIEKTSLLPQSRSAIRQSCIHASKIIGWGAYLPPLQITSADITDKLEQSGYKNVGAVIEMMTGIKSRRYAGPEMYPSDLAAAASLRALESAGLDAKDVDAIIFCGVSRDFDEPATANIVQEKIGAKNSYVFDLSNACNGFMSSLDVADAFIASGRYENILVTAGELISPYIDWEPKSRSDLKLSSMGYTLGDAGGAAVLTRVSNDDQSGIRARWFLSDGEQWRVAIIPPMTKDGTRFKFKSDGAAIERVALMHVPSGVESVLEMLEWEVEDIALIVPHQVASPVTENILYKQLGVSPERVIWTFPKYGNNGAASMPVAMSEALRQGMVQEGGKVLFIGGSGGFGAGVIALIV